jgi:hypothetical protein
MTSCIDSVWLALVTLGLGRVWRARASTAAAVIGGLLLAASLLQQTAEHRSSESRRGPLPGPPAPGRDPRADHGPVTALTIVLLQQERRLVLALSSARTSATTSTTGSASSGALRVALLSGRRRFVPPALSGDGPTGRPPPASAAAMVATIRGAGPPQRVHPGDVLRRDRVRRPRRGSVELAEPSSRPRFALSAPARERCSP